MNPGSCDDVLTVTRISKQKPAHGGLKQPARRNQIEDGGRISFQFLAVTFFFFFAHDPFLCAAAGETQSEEGREG